MTVQYRRKSQIFETEFSGTKFVIKRENDNTRKQLLVLEGEVILAFVERGERFSQCLTYKDISSEVTCQVEADFLISSSSIFLQPLFDLNQFDLSSATI